MKITKTVAGQQARALEQALATSGIAIKHTKAMDLVCAAHGLRSRQVLAAEPEGSSRPHHYLKDVALRSARRDEARYERLLMGTTAITHPIVTVERDGKNFAIPMTAFEDVEGFVDNGGLSDLVGSLASEYYFTRYRQENRGPWPLRDCNKIARKLVDAARSDWDGMTPEGVLEEILDYDNYDGWDAVRDQGLKPIADVAEGIRETASEFGVDTRDEEWVEALHKAVGYAVEEGDDSKGSDALSELDVCEVFFQFGHPHLVWEDNAVVSNKPWSEPRHLQVNDDLRRALAGLGWTTTEFRKAFDNREEATTMRSNPKVRKEKLLDRDELAVLIENACTQFMGFGLYAMVPIKDLLDLDLDKPLRFSRAAISVWNPSSGTFFDVKTVEDVVVTPASGRLEACYGYTPDEVCGFVKGAYMARIGNETD